MTALMMVPAQNQNLDTITLNGAPCGLTGKPGGSLAQHTLNRHKNRYQTPDQIDIDPQVSLAAMLAPGNDVNRFDQSKAATIRGFVINVSVGGTESCNCDTPIKDEKDTHIELGLAPDVPETQRVIIEVTPRMRMIMGDGWKTDALSSTYKGHWIEVTGWLTFDTAHVPEAENTNPGNSSDWRATCWEIHPVTSIQLLDSPPDEATGFQPASLAALQKLHASHVARAPHGPAAIEKLHNELLSGFTQAEKDEAKAEARLYHPHP
jgi:hypothetical protein